MAYKITHNESGEVHYTLDTIGYDVDLHTIEEIDRQPRRHERWENGAWLVEPALDVFLHEKVDQITGELRKQFITVAPGQEMTYLRKEDQARRLLAGGNINSCKMIAAEAQALGKDPLVLAQEVIDKADQWDALGSAIEARRLTVKAAIAAAETAEAKEAAAEALTFADILAAVFGAPTADDEDVTAADDQTI